MSVNKVILVGRVGKNPDVKYTDGGTCVAKFPFATDDSYKKKDSGEKVSITDWHNIVIWRGLAEVVEKYVNKGDQLFLEGKIKTRRYVKNNEDRYITEIIVDNMQMLGGNSKKEKKEEPKREYKANNFPEEQKKEEDQFSNDIGSPDEDLPF
jgi:single-strand DNA-binding protein